MKLFTVCVVTRFSFGCPPGCLMKINSHGVSLNLLLLSPIVQALYSVTLQTLEQISFKSHKYNMSYIITYQNMLIYYILKSKEIHVMESIGKNLNRWCHNFPLHVFCCLKCPHKKFSTVHNQPETFLWRSSVSHLWGIYVSAKSLPSPQIITLSSSCPACMTIGSDSCGVLWSCKITTWKFITKRLGNVLADALSRLTYY